MKIPSDSNNNSVLTPGRAPAFQQVLGAGRYELLEFVSKGGMGAVYRARDLELNRQVAIKCIIDIKRKDARTLALTEARTLAALEHNNIMRIYDVLAEGDQIWIVSEWIEGRSLSQMQKPISTEAVLAIAAQLFDALATAHAASVIHRDIKPANVMITPTGRVIIIDFGVAFAPGVSSGDTMAGSLRYTDPRILEGKKPDEWSDLFSVSLLIFELLTGEVALPNLAPLPLYRHIKKHLKGRIEMLSDGLYPPLAKIAQSICERPEDHALSVSGRPAKDVANIVNKLLISLCDDTPENCIEKYFNQDEELNQTVELAFKQQTSIKLKDNKIGARERTAWAAFRAFQDHDFSHANILNEDVALTPQPEITVEKFSFVKSISLFVGFIWLLYIPYLITHDQEVYEYAHETWKSLRNTNITYVKNNATFVPPIHPLVSLPQYPDTPTVKTIERPIKKPQKNIAKVAPKKRRVPKVVQRVVSSPAEPKLLRPLIKNSLNLKPLALVSTTASNAIPAPISSSDIEIDFIANAWAKMYVDGVEVGRLPSANSFALSSGVHYIKLLNPYFELLEQEITISKEIATSPVRLTMVPLSGEYKIRMTEPAQLIIDGQDYGLLSSKKIRLNYGRHFIEFKRNKTTFRPKNFFIGPKTRNVIWLDKSLEQLKPQAKADSEAPHGS